MPQGDPGGHMADTGGYGGNFGGVGGAARNAGGSGTEHGLLGFGGMSPGGYNSTTYNANRMGWGGVPGFGARVAANRANYAQRQQLQGFLDKYPNNLAAKKRLNDLVHRSRAPVDATERVIATEPFSTKSIFDRIAPSEDDAVIGANEFNPSIGANPFGPTSPQDNTGVIGSGMLSGGNFGYDSDNFGFGGNQGNFFGGGGATHRQFGGPVAPGKQYTVGENGPETLQMNATGGGQVIPHNPMDRLGSMDPQMMQQMFQLMRQQKKSQPMVPPPPPAPPADPAMATWQQQRPEWGGDPTQKMAFKDSIHAWKDQRPEWGGGHNGGQPPAGPPPVPRPQGGGGWQQGMTPPATMPPAPVRPPMGGGGGTGFGLSGLGQPGVMGQLRQRFGQG